MSAAAPRRTILGVTLDALTMEQTVARCVEAVENRENLTIGVVNAAKAVHMGHDALLRDSVTSCDVVVADGQAVVWASRFLGHPLPERVAGIDLFTSLMAEGSRRSYRAYFLGARPEVLERVVAEVRRRHPGLEIAGSRDGYFTDDEAPEVAARIGEAKPDLLFLGMTSPKKEIFLARFADEIRAGVIHGVGGSFDVLAGKVRRAPVLWQRLGVEWLYRFLQEPLRLGPRYLSTNTRFAWMVVKEYVQGRGRA
ncbi:WecB/TagA/CpsF family glycosyltransferase [Sphaerisporangium perillae]|uniref:WecB/TagA/CpsF family glycosyltransferase n=1 Tax=Sphaerisporangium perillae TaxID=2935860 RepID=UPI0020102A4D|nr:WecB/TagA/CpsF family glycosyltransferase [Sphaerisporangium perillae]